MAAAKKGSASKSGKTKKTTSEKAQTSKSKPAAETDQVSQFWSIILFAAGILAFLLTIIEGSSGWNVIHHVLRGLLGVSVFLVPIILIYTAILIGKEHSQRTVWGRAMWGGGLIVLCSSVVQLMFAGAPQGDTFLEKCKYLYELGTIFEGGGMLSALIAWPLMKVFGVGGARIIACILLFIFIMLLSNLTLFQFFELLARPFKKMRAAIQNIREENKILDAYEEWEYDEEQEAIQLANSKPEPVELLPDYDINMEVESDEEQFVPPDFGTPDWDNNESELPIDVPIDGVVVPQNETAEKTVSEPQQTVSESPVQAVDPLEAMVSQAVAGGNKNVMPESFAEKIARTEENTAKIQVEHKKMKQYVLPSPEFLNKSEKQSDSSAAAELKEKADKLIETLKTFGVTATVIGIQRGPRVTRYEIKPAPGIKVSKITNLADEIALNLAAEGVRIEAPIPGKAAVGIELPNTNEDAVSFREIIESKEFKAAKSKLAFSVGKDIAGNVIIGDVAKMPHMIIAGTTGSGKSVCTNSIIMSILYRATPDEVKLILIDPKMVEFTSYNGIPHLLIPVVTDPRKAAGALNWSVQEMLRRYKLFADNGVKDILGYNEKAEQTGVEKMPQIVIGIDEFADLMMAASKEVEDSVCRLAQMARAAGMHLIIATQRPTTDVITGLIKANIPSRIALTVKQQIDSRTILDMNGAEKLLGYGDMLYYPNGMQKPLRVQGCFCSTKEVETVVDFIKQQSDFEYDSEILDAVENSVPAEKSIEISSDAAGSGDEALIEKAVEIAVDAGQISTSALQRKLKLGFARAARIVDELEEMGVIGPSEGAKPRKVLISKQQWIERRARNTMEG